MLRSRLLNGLKLALGRLGDVDGEVDCLVIDPGNVVWVQRLQADEQRRWRRLLVVALGMARLSALAAQQRHQLSQNNMGRPVNWLCLETEENFFEETGEYRLLAAKIEKFFLSLRVCSRSMRSDAWERAGYPSLILKIIIVGHRRNSEQPRNKPSQKVRCVNESRLIVG